MVPSPSELRIDLALAAVPASVARFRAAVVDLAERSGAGSETIAAVRLPVSKAVTNAVLHAYDDGRREGEIRAVAWVEHGGGDDLVVVISDDGSGVRPRPDSPGLGLGLSLIAKVTRSLEVIDGHPGATIRMGFALP